MHIIIYRERVLLLKSTETADLSDTSSYFKFKQIEIYYTKEVEK